MTPASLPSTMSAGQFFLRRIGWKVTLKVAGVVWAPGLTLPMNAFPSGLNIGQGFASSSSSSSSQRVAVYASDVDVMTYDALVPYVAGVSTLYLRHMWVESPNGRSLTTVASRGRGFWMEWTTDQVWPIALPGVAAA